MKKPDKMTIWMFVQSKKSEYVDWNGKPMFDHFIDLPSWLARAYNLRCSNVEMTIHAKNPPLCDRKENYAEYVKANWSKKLTKMRKLNNNYIQFIPPEQELKEIEMQLHHLNNRRTQLQMMIQEKSKQ